MGLQIVEARLAEAAIRDVLAQTARLSGFGARLVGDDPLYIPLTHLPLPSFFTFTRASDAWFRLADDSDGERWLAAGGNDVPRIHCPGGKLSARGALLEVPRTNYALRSQALNQDPPWTLQGTPVIVTDAVVSPDGTQNAETIEDDSTGSVERVEQSSMGLALSAHIASIFAKYYTGTVNGRLNFHDGTTQHTQDLDQTGLWARHFNGPWTVTDANLSYIGAFPAPSAGTNLGKYGFWGAQVEAGSYPTSYMKTDGVNFARQKDQCNINLGSWQTNRLTGARGRVRFQFRSDWANGELDSSRAQMFCLTANDYVGFIGGSGWTLINNGVTRDTTADTPARGDEYAFDWQWEGSSTKCRLWKNGTELAAMTGTWVAPTLTGNIALGAWSIGSWQAGGVLRALILG